MVLNTVSAHGVLLVGLMKKKMPISLPIGETNFLILLAKNFLSEIIMATKSNKQKILVCGGPFSGQKLWLSKSVPAKGYTSGDYATIMFQCKGMIGRYVGAKWKPYENPSVIPDNIILGEN
jgi:hypothetical protein